MTLKDISSGPDWVLWVVFVIFAVLSMILLSGHGANLIARLNIMRRNSAGLQDVGCWWQQS